ncbi:hypothetical protein VM1G_07793 [Cytospora mali]|uniref:Uncharacterized protein n=1 Tax=Cytospora mali TaxID=578113 RepID=A0A194W7E9_CYTMA|nr:hypothetical protein VM1G_07793 [Valsa mali]
MHSTVFSLVALAVVRGVLAVPQAAGCATPTATVTVTEGHPVCFPVCIEPTSSCSPGEPTGPTPTPPVTSTVISPSACTATVDIRSNPGCNNCATCTSAALAVRATTHIGEKWCPTPTTVSTTVEPTSPLTCECPFVPVTCSNGGSLTVAPLPTSTLTEGCTVSVVAGPADCSNVCPTCSYPARVMARATTTLPGEKWCPTPTTVSTTVGPQSTKICACPAILSSCTSGQPTVKPLPTTTLTEGCTASVIAGPGDCSNVCPTCAY